MTENNIHKFPDLLELRAQKINAAIERRKKGDEEWIEGTLDLATELVAARKDHSDDDVKFGKWLKGRFGNNLITHQDRAILIREGKNPDQMRLELEKTESRSLRMIFTSTGKEGGLRSTAKTPPVGGSKTKSVHAAIQALEASGVKLTQEQIAKALDVSVGTVGEAARDLRASQAAETITYTKAQEHHVEARIRVEVKAAIEQLNASFETEVQKRNKVEIDKLFPGLEKLREDAKRDIKIYRDLIAKNALFTEDEVMDIIKACHPDNSATKEVRSRAFIAVNAKKFILMGKMQ